MGTRLSIAVIGAGMGGLATAAALLRPSIPAASASCATIRACTRMAFNGLRARWPSARRSSSVSVEIGSGCHGRLAPGAGTSGVASVSISIISCPAAPSMVAWWNFVSSAQRPSWMPSMT